MTGDTDWMSLTDWVIALRQLHKQAQQGKLPPDELRRYYEERDTLAKAILAAQRLRAAPSARGRQALRVARELNVEINIEGRRTQTRTLDLGAGGFAVMMAAPPRTGALVTFTLELEGSKRVSGKARVLSLQRKGKPYRVAFRFEPLEAGEREDLNTTIFDIALEGVMPKDR